MEDRTQTDVAVKAVHAAGLVLSGMRHLELCPVQEGLVEEARRALPGWYGIRRNDGPIHAGDVEGILASRRVMVEWMGRYSGDEATLMRAALSSVDASLMVLGMNPEGKRAPLAPVVENYN